MNSIQTKVIQLERVQDTQAFKEAETNFKNACWEYHQAQKSKDNLRMALAVKNELEARRTINKVFSDNWIN